MSTSILEFEKALNSLEKALNENKTDITRDASIQRYEFCVELAWKTAKKIMGSSSAAPKVVVREMGAQLLIDDVDEWFVFLEKRNLSSHTYKEEIADSVYESALIFLPKARALLDRLKKI